ncbi:MAG TPA: hypothetical protein DCE44_23230 [Verrucomicrobiales bacterium]|nr:hypothetical protein [Verrucomicrobiales bacterium]
MSATSKVDSVWFTTKGQVVIPAWLRREFHVENGTKAVVQSTPEGILLKPVTRWAIDRGHGLLKRVPNYSLFGACPQLNITVPKTATAQTMDRINHSTREPVGRKSSPGSGFSGDSTHVIGFKQANPNNAKTALPTTSESFENVPAGRLLSDAEQQTRRFEIDAARRSLQRRFERGPQGRKCSFRELPEG